ncbi:hypothetical protein ID866_2497 [Astraeus odoratus]|nr:hypothetical protein ID866_2497 [Astraeus odoratus]
MSSIHSPGPSNVPNNQMFSQSASTTPSARQKSKAYTAGIAAGVEDEKYHAKYRELKRKVKEIELDNDKLRFKVLAAKKSIQRMKLERAVLYERLSAVPPSPDLHNHHSLPPIHPGPGVPPQHSQPGSTPSHHRDHSRNIDANDHSTADYIHSAGNIRVIPGPDGRPVQVSDGPIGPGVPPSHAISAVHMSRRSSSGQDSRQLPPLSQFTPVQHLEHQRPPVHSQGHSPHLHPHSSGPDSRSRSHSSSSRLRGPLPSQGPPHSYHPGGIPHPQQYSPEPGHPGPQGPHSPPMGHERDRSRRHDSHERGNHDPHPHARQQMSHASSHSVVLSPPSGRGSSSRVHHHQRIGPGASVGHAEYENEREMEREREHAWSRQREYEYDREGPTREYAGSGSMHASPPPPSHMRSRPEYQEPPSSSYRQPREEQRYTSSREPIGPGVYGRTSRSDTPGSGSGSVSGNGNGSGNGGGVGDAQSRGDQYHAQYFDRERPRPYAPRAINHHQAPNDEKEYVHEEGRPAVATRDRIGGTYLPSEQHQQQAHHLPSMDMSRKRSRNDMEIDGEDETGLHSPSGNNSSGGGEGPSRYNSASHDRGVSKRLHQDGQGYGGHDEAEEEHSD